LSYYRTANLFKEDDMTKEYTPTQEVTEAPEFQPAMIRESLSSDASTVTPCFMGWINTLGNVASYYCCSCFSGDGNE